MPIHDWTQVDAGIFHDFHQAWTVELATHLNMGGLQDGFFAMLVPSMTATIPEVVAFGYQITHQQGDVAVAEAPPDVEFRSYSEVELYVGRANTVAIKRGFDDIVAVIEIVSPGNKNSQYALRTFVEKSSNILRSGVNLLVIDLFPPTARDPQGIHKAIWDEICDEPFKLPEDKPLTIAAYMAGELKRAYVEPIGVGDLLPSLPIFLDQRIYVPAPLEATYQSTWSKCPAPMRELVEKRKG